MDDEGVVKADETKCAGAVELCAAGVLHGVTAVVPPMTSAVGDCGGAFHENGREGGRVCIGGWEVGEFEGSDNRTDGEF